MSQTKANKIVSKLRFEVGRRRKLRNPDGPEGRLLKLRQTVTALIKHERIELNYNVGDESRGYAERLISDAIRYGEKHKETMDTASYWLLEKQLVHKLFKVLVPRYQDCKFSYTKIWKAPTARNVKEKCVLELRDNIYPNLVPNIHGNHFLLHNLLLDEARRDFEEEENLLKKKMKKGKTEKFKSGDWEEWDEVKEAAAFEKWNSLDKIDIDGNKDLTSNTMNNTSSNNKNNNNTSDNNEPKQMQ